MPAGTDPPILGLPKDDFDALRSMTYDAQALAFRDASGTPIYLFGRRDPVFLYQGGWFRGTDAQGAVNPKGLIPQITAAVIQGGTYNVVNGTIAYLGLTYAISLLREAGTGNQLAQAVPIT
jgi:hypothetical protein